MRHAIDFPSANEPASDNAYNGADNGTAVKQEAGLEGDDMDMNGSAWNGGGNQSYDNVAMDDDNYGPINVKEDG